MGVLDQIVTKFGHKYQLWRRLKGPEAPSSNEGRKEAIRSTWIIHAAKADTKKLKPGEKQVNIYGVPNFFNFLVLNENAKRKRIAGEGEMK
jgi:hypothetical protein